MAQITPSNFMVSANLLNLRHLRIIFRIIGVWIERQAVYEESYPQISGM